MDRNEIKSQLMDVFESIGWIDMEKAVNEDSRLDDDLGFDSLDKIEVCMEIEKDFGIVIHDDEMDRIKTVGDVVNLLDEIINE